MTPNYRHPWPCVECDCLPAITTDDTLDAMTSTAATFARLWADTLAALDT